MTPDAPTRPFLRVESRFGRRVVSFFQAEASPHSLAAVRIVVFLTLAWQVPIASAVEFAGLPEALRFPPTGLGWLDGILPIDPATVRLAAVAMLAGAYLAAAGFRTKWTGWVAVVAAAYVYGVPNFYGKVDHYHFIVWFPAILAASPSSDVWSVDAWLDRRRNRHRPTAPHLRYGLPIRFMWALIGLIYFFPGLYKLLAGWDWVFSDNLRFRLIDRGLLTGGPIIRIDGLPDPVLWIIAASVIVFELGFIVALLFPRIRPWAIAGGVLFHVGVYLFMDINFLRLLAMYVVFVPWDRVTRRIGREQSVHEHRPAAAGVSRVSIIVGSTIIALTIWTGVADVPNGWPFASFPKFDEPLTEGTSRMATYTVIEGTEQAVDLREQFPWMPAHRLNGLVTRVASEADPSGLTALWRAGVAPSDIEALRIYRLIGTRIEGSSDINEIERRLLMEAPG